ncbi:MAG: T9SS type A sorting domain-containing protein [Flavobacteriales bacterium]|nr:T9SS type A sorting domain-containing protein [Flavobacteriales bacterium]
MKHNYLLLSSFILVIGGIILTSNANGPASNGNRATNAPGDGATKCTSCHTGGSFGDVSIDLTVNDGNGAEVSEYAPDEVYSVSVNVSSSMGTPSGHGFQAIALEDAGDTPLNGFSNAGSGVQFSVSSSRQYAEHSGPSASGAFAFDWTAPSAGTGSVTFYMGANAVNVNGSNGGDNAVLFEVSFAEMADTNDTNSNQPPAGIFAISAQEAAIQVFPNPVQGIVQLKGLASNQIVEVYSIKGEWILSEKVMANTMDLSSLQSGVYILRSEGKKYKYAAFKRKLLEIYEHPMDQQKEALYNTILDWMGTDHEQIDDICIVAVRI